MSSKYEKHEWEFPHLKEAHQMPGVNSDFWSVKFYPYSESGVDPVFAVVGGKRIFVCRPPSLEHGNTKLEVTQLIIDEEPEADHYACAWTKDLETGTPLLCVSGTNAKIKIINALTGELLRTLIGHGGEINDLVVSPVNPYILASASEDSTVRLWSLDPAHEKQPCAAILEGDGHRETVLTLSFHASGRYLLSGGIDHIINLWTLPKFPDQNTGTSKATRIYYPHFSTSEIHSDIVDCVAWHGDLILSKAANEHCIVLWSITGFSSTNSPPLPSTAPTTHDTQRLTRSAFTPTSTTTSSYTRYLQFSIPDSEIIFMRFSLFPGTPTNGHPIMAFCNTASKVHFWDFDRLEQYYDWTAANQNNAFAPTATLSFSSSHSVGLETQRPPFLVPFQRRNRGGGLHERERGGPVSRLARERENSPTESASSHHTGSDSHPPETDQPKGPRKVDWERSKTLWNKKYDMGDSLHYIEAHKEETIKGYTFTGRQVAWSADGEWCVVVGSSGVIGVLQRWGK